MVELTLIQKFDLYEVLVTLFCEECGVNSEKSCDEVYKQGKCTLPSLDQYYME